MNELNFENIRWRQLNFIIFAYMFMIFICQNGIDLLVSIISPNLTNKDWYSLAITIVGDFLIAMPVFLILIKKIPKDNIGKVYKLNRKEAFQVLCVLVLIIYSLSSFRMFLSNMVIPLAAQTCELKTIENSNVYLISIYGIIIAPIKEEIIFRNVIIDRLRRYGSTFAIFYSALLFGLYHGDIFQSLYTFGLGIAFGYILLKTNRIIYPIIYHSISNLITLTPYLFKFEDSEIYVFGEHKLFLLLYGAMLIICITCGLVVLIRKRKNIKIDFDNNQLVKLKGWDIFNIGFLFIIAISLLKMYFSYRYTTGL